MVLPFACAATVTAHSSVYVTPSTVMEAVTVHVPAATAVTVPLLTVAFVMSLLFQVTVAPTGTVVADKLPVAPPTVRESVSLSSVTLGIVPFPRTNIMPFSARSLK